MSTQVRVSGNRRQAAPKPRGPGRRRGWVGLSFIAPALAVLCFVIAIPLFVAVYQSMTNKRLTQVGEPKFVGADNYELRVFSDTFGQALVVTVLIMVLSLLVQLPIGYWLAICLERNTRSSKVLRSVITLPIMLTPVAVGLMWRYLADPTLGIIRWAAGMFEAGAQPNPLGSPVGALLLVVIVNSWIHIPFVTLLILAGLLGVPDELYEAAVIDGASRWQLRLNVTIPSIMPVLAVTCVLRLAGDYRMFDIIYTVTHGGPGSATRNLSALAYFEGLTNFNIGRACAVAVAMAVLAIPAYLAYRKVSRA